MSRKIYKVSLSQKDASILEEKLKTMGVDSFTAFVRKVFKLPAEECKVWEKKEDSSSISSG